MSELIMVDGPEAGYSFDSSGKRLFISKPGTYTIANIDPDTAVNGFIDIGISGSDKDITLVLSGVHLQSQTYGSIRCYYKCNLTIQLADGTTNTLYAKKDYGIAVYNSSSLTIKGNGALYVKGGVEAKSYSNYYYAGIGPGNVTIESGKIYATGAKHAPGIGARNYTETYTFDGSLECYSDTTSNITINGGYVEAAGGEYAAGIGGGYAGQAKNITINGGTVIAKGGRNAAGIGGGYRGGAQNITINGGTVTATSSSPTGNSLSAAIGGGYLGKVQDITLSGGEIIARTGEGYSAIGYYDGTAAENVNVTLAPLQEKRLLVKTGTAKNNITKETSYSQETSINNMGLLNYVHITTGCIQHTGGKATCKTEAICTACEKPYGDKDFNNHDGDTEIRNAVDATYEATGYTGDAYCLGCGNLIQNGTTIPKLPTPPETGDNFSLYLWMGMLILSTSVMVALKSNALNRNK
ncbi:MAG: carbohydrate-binding domain-containing protein [Clostridia bacterium]|nr:carbohydrate-binding domain-containing protein [Clostridia bacterium]